MLKDLTAYLTPNLEIPWQDRTFSVPPPSKDVGIKLAAINAAGVHVYLETLEVCPTCGRGGALGRELPEDTQATLEAIGSTDLGVLSLGPAYQEMVDAGVPAPHIDTFALYALYYWTLGEETADRIIAAKHGAEAGETAPKASTSGRGTASGNRSTGSTGSRSTRTTTRQRTSSRAGKTTGPASGGGKSSNTGA
ncbi:DUF7426 family protein [Cellulosimicrobium funkei]|uniref:DUF7426 family protein n=1 Tax=Cellulosimicrobium funkei TaxID=264251 RepID=UPI00344599DC